MQFRGQQTNSQNSRIHPLLLVLLVLVAGCSRPVSKETTTVRFVRVPYLSMAPLVIAEQEGYFREQKLEIKLVTFRRAGDAVAALARGQVDVVAGSVNLVLLNAIEKGANIRIVADKGHYTPSSCVVSALLVHRDALQDGTLASLSSLRGRKVDLRENSILSYAYDSLLQRDRLTLGDVEMVSLPRGGQLAALQNRAVAAVSAADPRLTQFQDSGPVVVWHSINEAVERPQYSMIAFGPTFLDKSSQTGNRFMIAYLKGVRQYNEGKTERNLAIMAKEAGVSASVLSRWEGLGRAGLVSPLFFPTPSVILGTLVDLFRSGELVVHLGATMSRMAGGFLAGSALGVMIGLPMGWSPRLQGLLDPFVAAMHPVPKISLLPLVMIVLGIGEAPNLVVIALASFFPMLISSLAGVHQISPLYCEVAKNYGATPLRMFHRVILPGSLPLIFAGIRLALNSALVVTISVELVAAEMGLGSMIWTAWETLRIEALYATVFLTALLGLSFSLILNRLARWAIPWQV